MPDFRSLHFGLRHRVIAFVSTRAFANITYTMRHGLAAGMRRKGGLGFLPLGAQHTAETKFLSNLDLAGKTVYDIGGFEGVLTMFFARKASAVVTYEPTPRNYRRCLENVNLNGLSNVTLLNRGVSSEPGELQVVYDPLMPGAASAKREVSQQINASVASAKTVSITVVTLDDDIAASNLPRPDFIKIDIEGMELPALRGMRRTLTEYSPELYIELHGAELADKFANAVAVVELLEKAGYRVFDVEGGKYLTASTVDPHPPSHIYCTGPIVAGIQGQSLKT